MNQFSFNDLFNSLPYLMLNSILYYQFWKFNILKIVNNHSLIVLFSNTMCILLMTYSFI